MECGFRCLIRYTYKYSYLPTETKTTDKKANENYNIYTN